LVEHHLAKVRVAGSNPVVRSRDSMWRRCRYMMALFAALCSAVACSNAPRYDATVAAASDTRDAFAEIAALMRESDGVEIGFVFGSSGMLREQVLNDAPFDVYVSANVSFVDDVVAKGKGIADTQRSFAVGQLAIVAAEGVELPQDIAAVAAFERVVIANPAHAPYGVAARQALISAGVYTAMANRLVLADNVADAVRIVEAGEAQVGIVALPLVISADHVVVPESLHEPIRQSLVITTRAANNAAAQRFVQVLESPAGKAILARYGFTVDLP
jgi:molybdate transport system substrate-binding protein